MFYDEATSVALFRVSARVPAGQASFTTAAVVPLSKNNKLRLTHAPPVSASEGSVSVKFEILRCKRGGKCWEVEHMFSDGMHFALQVQLVKSGRMKAEGK